MSRKRIPLFSQVSAMHLRARPELLGASSGDLTEAARLLPELEEAIAVLHAALKQKG